MKNEERKSLAYRLGEMLGTAIIGSIIIVIVALTIKFVFWLF